MDQNKLNWGIVRPTDKELVGLLREQSKWMVNGYEQQCLAIISEALARVLERTTP